MFKSLKQKIINCKNYLLKKFESPIGKCLLLLTIPLVILSSIFGLSLPFIILLLIIQSTYICCNIVDFVSIN